MHFKANDGTADSNVSTLTITVTGTNDAPVANVVPAGTFLSADEGGSASGTIGTTIPVSLFATDVDSTLTAASLTFTSVTIDGVLAGSLAAAGISYNGSTGAFSFNGNVGAYDHLRRAHATVVVSFTASDGSLTSNVGSVTFVVDGTNDAPVVSGAVVGTATEDGSASTLDALANATDVDDLTTLSVTGVPAMLPAGVSYNAGTHSFTLNPADAAYQHLAAGATTTVSVLYQVSRTSASVSWTGRTTSRLRLRRPMLRPRAVR